jgi:hypothetical protein
MSNSGARKVNVVHFVIPKDLPLRLKTEGTVGLTLRHFANVVRHYYGDHVG